MARQKRCKKCNETYCRTHCVGDRTYWVHKPDPSTVRSDSEGTPIVQCGLCKLWASFRLSPGHVNWG